MSSATRLWVLRTLLAALFAAALSWALDVHDPIPWDPPTIAPLLQALEVLLSLLAFAMIPAGILAVVSTKRGGGRCAPFLGQR